jgi:hypothetical protein
MVEIDKSTPISNEALYPQYQEGMFRLNGLFLSNNLTDQSTVYSHELQVWHKHEEHSRMESAQHPEQITSPHFEVYLKTPSKRPNLELFKFN